MRSRARGDGRRRALGLSFLGPVTLGLPWIAGCAAPPAQSEDAGVVVEAVVAGGAADRAGLEVGDRILSWSRVGETTDSPQPAGGLLASPLDLHDVEAVQAPLGTLTLAGWRGAERWDAALPADRWRLAVRPAFDGTDLDDYLAGRRLIEAEEIEAGLARWRAAVARAVADRRQHEALWLLSRMSAAAEKAAQAEQVQALEREALELAAADPQLVAWWWEQRAAGRRPPGAVEAYRAALRTLPPEHPLRARLLYLSCTAAYRQGRTDAAESSCREARSRWQRVAPAGVDEILAGVVLAKIERNRGQHEAAIAQLEELAAAAAALDPDGRLRAQVASELGITADYLGDLAAAARWQRQALEVYERLGVRDADSGQARMALGILAWRRGDLDEAEGAFRTALEVFQEAAPGTPLEAWGFQGLGTLALDRGNYAAAERSFRRGLEIASSAGARYSVALAFSNLGTVAKARGDLATAADRLEEALGVLGQPPTSVLAARTLGELGSLRGQTGELGEARAHLDAAVAWFEDHAPGGPTHAAQLVRRGRLAEREGRHADAERDLTTALRVVRRFAPGSLQEADTLWALATLRREQRRLDDARRLLEQAIAAVEAQRRRLGGSGDAESSFGASVAPIYRELIELLVGLGVTEEAFWVLERYRAQGLLALLGRRELLLDRHLPPELLRRRKALARRYEGTQKRLEALDSRADPNEVQALVDQLHTLREQRQVEAAELLAVSPELADLIAPTPLDARASCRTLDPGTLVLSYVVLPSETFLFALDAGPSERLDAVPLGIGEEALRREVEAFLYLLRSPRIDAARAGLEARSRSLYDRLVAPVAGRIAAAERLLVVPDGPLHALPFGALMAQEAGERFLAARKPIHTAISLTVYGQLTARRGERRGRPTTLVAFGDPQYERPATPASPRLPATRAEVVALRSLFPDAETYLGRAATEGRAKAAGERARYLHFACHGAVDDRFPLDSYLALSPPAAGETDNGRLQAWEIFEELRLDADLVTLSACETGLGAEVGGEGLVGLTRAFHYAGARSVVASLWSVTDRSTAALMASFYGHLRAGVPKDQALRAAQLELLRTPVMLPPRGIGPFERLRSFLRRRRGPADAPDGERFDASHPFHWAAFQLIGDWR